MVNKPVSDNISGASLPTTVESVPVVLVLDAVSVPDEPTVSVGVVEVEPLPPVPLPPEVVAPEVVAPLLPEPLPPEVVATELEVPVGPAVVVSVDEGAGGADDDSVADDVEIGGSIVPPSCAHAATTNVRPNDARRDAIRSQVLLPCHERGRKLLMIKI